MCANWYEQVTRKIHFDMHTPDDVENVGANFDPEAFARSVKEAGAEAVCFFARCAYGWSYYPTHVGVPHPYLTKDLFGSGVKALKAEGIRVLAYVAICGIPGPQAAKHPEWLMRQPGGTARGKHGAAMYACASLFLQEGLIPQLQEIARQYEVDGFFLDGVYQFFNNVCHCERCRGEFTGPIPVERDDPNWRAWCYWQTRRVWTGLGRAAVEITELRPGCLMGVNWLSSIRWSVPPPKSMGYLTGDPPLRNATFETSFNLAAWAWRDKPADAMNERMLENWQDFTCRTPETIETEFAAGLAAGGKLFTGDLLQPVDVKPDPEVMRLIRRCFDFAAQREPITKGARPKSDIAILSSPETIRQHRSGWRVDETPLRGAYLASIEDGLTVDILYDADLQEHLGRYKTLVVPEQRFIGRKACRAIRDFVKAGGGLAVIGSLPKTVDPEEPDSAAEVSVFEEITGLTDEGDHQFDLAYLLLRGTSAEDLWRHNDDFRPPIPVPGTSAKVRAVKAEVLCPLTAPGQSFQLGAFPPGQKLESPALTLHRYGKGTVAFCALPLASDIWKRGNPGAKYVLQKMIRRVTAQLSVERIGPACVQIHRCQKARQTIIHLVAYQPDRRIGDRQLIESPGQVSGVQVKLRDRRQPAAVHAEPGGIYTQNEREGDMIVVEAPPFGIHTAIVFDWE